MTTEVILTDEQIRERFKSVSQEDYTKEGWVARQRIAIGRAIEQDVLQSPEVQRLREDAGRYRAWRKAIVTDDIGFLNVYIEFDDGSMENTEDHMDKSIDAAMEKQP